MIGAGVRGANGIDAAHMPQVAQREHPLAIPPSSWPVGRHSLTAWIEAEAASVCEVSGWSQSARFIPATPDIGNARSNIHTSNLAATCLTETMYSRYPATFSAKMTF